MANPIDIFGTNTMDPVSAFGTQTEPGLGGVAGPAGGEITAGGGFNPVNNTQLESIFPTSNNPPFAAMGVVGGPEQNPIPPSGGTPFPPDFVPPPETNPFPVDLPQGGPVSIGGGGGTTIPVDPVPVGGRPEGGLIGGPTDIPDIGPDGRPIVRGLPNPPDIPDIDPNGRPIVRGQASSVNFVNPAGQSQAMNNLPPALLQRLLAILAARQRAAG